MKKWIFKAARPLGLYIEHVMSLYIEPLVSCFPKTMQSFLMYHEAVVEARHAVASVT